EREKPKKEKITFAGSIIPLLQCEIYWYSVTYIHSLSALFAGNPFGQAVYHAQSFFVKRRINAACNFCVGHLPVFIHYKRNVNPPLNTIFLCGCRIIDIVGNKLPEFQFSAREFRHFFNYTENLLVAIQRF